jgi:hypothetical protein
MMHVYYERFIHGIIENEFNCLRFEGGRQQGNSAMDREYNIA